MTTRRDVLQLGALGAAGLAGIEFGKDGSSGDAPSRLAPQNTPVPYRGVFRRPPELVPYETTSTAVTRPAVRPLRPHPEARAGPASCPGLTTTVAGYNGIFPGPTIRASQGTRAEVRIRNALPASRAPAARGRSGPSTHLHGSASLPQYDGYANDITAPGCVKNYHYPNWQTARTLWYHDHNGTTSPPRTCTRAWPASTRSPTRSSGPSCRRASTTCR